MAQPSLSSRRAVIRAQHALTKAVRLVSAYLIPLAIAVLSLVALTQWDSLYAVGGEQMEPLRVLPETGAALTPAQALPALAARAPVPFHDTRLSEKPVWFSLITRGAPGDADVVEIPSRHALQVDCWDPESLRPIGHASHGGAAGALSQAKAGFALRLWNTPTEVLCRARFAGPARLTAVQWPADQFALSTLQFHRQSGLLDGGMIVLALFILLTALINRTPVYVLFASWLVMNLRMGALYAGWDIQWLGQLMPEALLVRSRALTVALYGLATLALYMALFGAELRRSRLRTPLRAAQAVMLVLTLTAFVLPLRIFLPLVWVTASLWLPLVTISLVSVLLHSQSRVAFWFAMSFVASCISLLAQVLDAAFAVRELSWVANGVSMAVASSLLGALAVAERMREETEQRRAAQAELRRAYEATPLGLFTLDLKGHFLSANPALCAMLGVAGIETGSAQWQQFFPAEQFARLRDGVHQQNEAELELVRRDADQRYLVRATLSHGRIEAVLEDITHKLKVTEQLRFMANNDPLTKVFNRRGIEKMFEAGLAARADGKPLALAYIDLDRFKLINDLFGHGAGDEVLIQVCERVAAMLAGGQQIGRVGGDEFVLVLPDTPVGLAALLCRAIVERIGGKPYRVGDKAFHVRGSIGLIEVAPGMAMKDAVSAADRACREAKRGDGLVVYERHAAAFQEREDELNLVARLSGPNPTQGLLLEMQPILSLKSPRSSLNFEVLLRLREPDGRIISAGPVIEAAEKSGRVSALDRWVLERTLGWIAANQARLTHTRFICMNLSGASLNDERFVQDTLAILDRYAAVAGRLCMEITESVALHDLDNTRRFIEQVRAFGVQVALDDFGAGYTSFSYLKELPADVLKIDGKFVVNLNAHPANVAIVEAIVTLAANLGMQTIAEWAEDESTVRTLAALGVDYVQGYAVAGSQPPERMLDAGSSAVFIADAHLVDVLEGCEMQAAAGVAA